ncbi:MAG: translation initiation factor IF-2 N-terminal domain-containing protein, partial [Solirubrobacteraceae bacterium]
MNKRVHEIAKERGIPAKDVLARLKAAGVEVKAASSSVDAEVAARVLGNGSPSAPAPERNPGTSESAAKPTPSTPPAKPASAGTATKAEAAAPGATASAQGSGGPTAATRAVTERDAGADQAPAAARTGDAAPSGGDNPSARPQAPNDSAHKRPTRDSLQGERSPGAAGG